MSAATQPSVTIEPEAAALAAELGMSAELEQMIEHARGLPGVYGIDVELAIPSDAGDVAGVTVFAWIDRSVDELLQTQEAVQTWELSRFPPEVLRYLLISCGAGSGHAG